MQGTEHTALLSRGTQRILMLAPCSYPPTLGTPVCIYALAHILGAAGHAVDVVTYAASPARNDSVPCMDTRAGSVRYHPVPGADVQPKSGPQRAKWRADWHLWRYARQLATQQTFDVIHAHHIEGIALGAALRGALGIALVGHMHTRLRMELSAYTRQKRPQRPLREAGRLLDRAAVLAANVTVTLNADDAKACRAYVGAERIFTRYPTVPAADAQTHLSRPKTGITALRAGYAIYSGNADAYQNLSLLAAAFQKPDLPLVVATHGATTAFDSYAWAKHVYIVRVDTFEQMRAWLRAASVGVCPRVQACGFPIKWLNYWQAGLPLVAPYQMGLAVYGDALRSQVHGPALWSGSSSASFAQACRRASLHKQLIYRDASDVASSYAEIYAAAKRFYHA